LHGRNRPDAAHRALRTIARSRRLVAAETSGPTACHPVPVDLGVVVGIVAGVLVLWVVLLGLFWFLRPRGVPARELVGVVPDLVRMLRDIVRDPASPLDVRIVLVALLVWILSPIDLIPEFIPVLGPLDDVLVAIVALRYVRRRVGVDGLRARWRGTDDGFALLGRVAGF
jgi:uncharacterized membrane protein YkvA (DUF1232 family)